MNFVHFAETLFQPILAATLFASVLAAIVWVLQLAWGKRLGPGWRHTLWLIVLVRFLLPILPESSFSLFNIPHWMGRAKPEPNVTVTFSEAPLSFNQPLLSSTDLDFVQPTTPPPLQLMQVAAGLWLGVSILLLVRLGLGSCWLRFRLARQARTAHPALIQAFAEARSRVRTGWNPRLIETPGIESPGLFGCFRPKLLLPAGLNQRLSETELRHIFLHELAHLKRGDLWMNALMSLAHALHWFNPVSWWLLRRMRLERELACDALVLRSGAQNENRAYGETILRLLDQLHPRPAFPVVVGILEEKHSAKLRLSQIANYRPGTSQAGRAACC